MIRVFFSVECSRLDLKVIMNNHVHQIYPGWRHYNPSINENPVESVKSYLEAPKGPGPRIVSVGMKAVKCKHGLSWIHLKI